MAEAQAPAAEGTTRHTDQAWIGLRDSPVSLRRRRHGQRYPRAALASTWMHCAASSRRVDTLVMGPEFEGSTTGGRTPLQLVCEATNELIVYRRGGTDEAFMRWVAEPPSRRREIDEGIHADRIACVALLLEHGASPNPAGP